MADIEPGPQSHPHGFKLAKSHKFDWIILVLLAAIYVALYYIEPFHRFVSQDMMGDLKFPLQNTTVRFWMVPLFAVILPIVIFVVVYFKRRDVYDMHYAILGILYAVLITGVITEALKDAVGRPRPDFFWRCFPDGNAIYNVRTMRVVCHGDRKVVKEGYKSFPSGHAAWSFAGLGFLAWYFLGKIRPFNSKGQIAKLLLVIFPLLAATLVAVTLVDDYQHHWQDVVVGSLIGLFVASVCYLQFFPPPHDVNGWGPRAYFRMLAETQSSIQPPASMNQPTSTPPDIESQRIPSENRTPSEIETRHASSENNGGSKLRETNHTPGAMEARGINTLYLEKMHV